MTYVRRSESREPKGFWGTGVVPERLSAVLSYVTHDGMILDLGSGRGAYTRHLRNLGFRTVGVDFHQYSEWKANQAPFVVGSATALPFPAKAFDTVVAFEVLEHVPLVRQALREMARCTRNQIIISVPNCDLDNNLRRFDLALAHWTDETHHNFFTKESIQQLLIEEGYRILEVRDCYRVSPNSYFWSTVKLPRLIARGLKQVFEVLNLVETYWSSTLVIAQVPAEVS